MSAEAQPTGCNCGDCQDCAPRSRAAIHAELREICARHMDPETLAWFRREFPLIGDQLEMRLP